jgi:hypothetical protein
MITDREKLLFKMLGKDVNQLRLPVRIKANVIATSSKTMLDFLSIADIGERYKDFGGKSIGELHYFLAFYGVDENWVIDDEMRERYYELKSQMLF